MYQFILECIRSETGVVLVVIIIIIALFVAIRELWKRSSGNTYTCKFRGYNTDYPETWNQKFKNSTGEQQSPINIDIPCCLVVRGRRTELIFSEKYFKVPKSITILNDGFSVLVGACFDDEYPIVKAGPLSGQYRFNLCYFRWGATDAEGSEHTINSVRYAMELQVMHIKGDVCYENLEKAVESEAVLFISYFFKIAPNDNPYISALVESLHRIEEPNSSVQIDPFPLSWLFHPFKKGFFYYKGSLTSPPCMEGVEWILQPEPISISSAQLKQFRRLRAIDGPMLSNTRPVQKIKNRKTYFLE